MKAYFNTQFTTVVQDEQETRVPDLGGLETEADVQYSVYDRGDSCLTIVTAYPSDIEAIRGASVTTEVTDDDVVADDSVPFGGPNVGLESIDQPDVEVDEELDKFNVEDLLDQEELNRAYIIHNWTRGPLERDDRNAILKEHNADNLRNLLYVTTEAERSEIVSEYGINSLQDHLDTSTVVRSLIQNQTIGRQVMQDQEMTAMNKAAKALGRGRADELSKHTRADMNGEIGHNCKCILEGRCEEHQKMLDYIKGRSDGTIPWSNDVNPPAKGSSGI